MSHDAGAGACPCVAEHRPPYLELAEHHVWPIYLGGGRAGQTVWLCNTTHSSVHEIMRLLVGNGRLTYAAVAARNDRPVARYAYALALRGYDAYDASRKEPTP